MKRTLLSLCAAWLLLLANGAHAVTLTAAERAFVEAHPRVSIAMMLDHPPFSVSRESGVVGFEHDLLRLITEKTGLRFEKEFGTWADALRRFRNGQVDVLASISFQRYRNDFTLYTSPYFRLPIYVFVGDDFGDYTGLSDLAGRKVGIIRDIFYEQELREAVDAQLVRFDTHNEVTRALVLGEIDAMVQNLANINHIVKRRAYSNIRLGGELGLPGLAAEDLRFGINPDKPELKSIIQKGLDGVTPVEWETLTATWLDEGDQGQPRDVHLTDAERAYLREAGPIDICIDPNWMPFERFNDNGDYEGISADYFALFERTLSTRFHPVTTETWTQSVEYLKAGKCDMFSLAMRTPEREKYLDFTDSYIETPLVIATKADVAFITGVNDLKGRKIAIPALYAFAELLRHDYPELDLIEVTDIDAGLEMVHNGEVFGYIGTLATIGYKLQTEYTGELRVTGDTGKSWDMGVAVREDKPILFGIMQKAVASVTEEQKRTINNKWISIRYEERIDYTLLWQVSAVFILLLVAGGLFYLKQAGLKRKLEAAYQQAERLAVTDKLTGVYNRHRLDQALGEETGKAERYGDVFGVVILDVDHFKRINDRHGHRSGDIVLREFVDVLRDNCRQTDILGRWGGEEFLIIVPHADKTTLLTLAEKLRAAIEAKPFSDVEHVTTSIGTSLYRQGDTPDTLVKRADDALYDAKGQGRNAVAFG